MSSLEALETLVVGHQRDMIQLPNLELKPERHELVKLMCAPFRQHPDYQKTKVEFNQFVNRMGNRNVLNCLAAMRGRQSPAPCWSRQ